MAAKHEGRHVLDRDLELFGQEVAETRRVEDAGHADHMALRQAREFLQRPYHRVERVGDADHESLGRVFLEAGADLLHDLEVDTEKIVAAHTGLARHAGRHDADIGALYGGVVIDAGEACVEIVDRGGLGDVEPLALRDAFGNIEEDDVAEFFQPDHVGEGAADHPGADEGDLVACHDWKFPLRRKPPERRGRNL